MASLDLLHPTSTNAALALAEANCSARGIRLTDSRRLILGLLLEAERPLGAYGLLERLQTATRHAVAPPTVYRALGFLVGQGLVHRIERLDAFVACSAVAAGGGAHAHAHQFLVCRRCGRAEEVCDPAISLALSRAASRAGFAPDRATVEVEGECARCGVARPVV